MGQLAAARSKLAEIGASAEEAKIRSSHLQKELKEKEPRAKKARSEDGGLSQELQSAKAEVAKLENEINSVGEEDAQHEDLRSTKEQHLQALNKLLEKRDTLKGGLARLNFDYTSPSRDFDRNTVKGLIANLISIDQSNFNKSTALEVCAGGRLYNVSLIFL